MGSKFLRYTLILGGVVFALILLSGGGMGIRFYFTGVSPFREFLQAMTGETIQVTENQAPDGAAYRHLLVDGIVHGLQYAEATRPNDRRPGWNWKRQPTTYYHVHSPVGLAFSRYNWCAPPQKTLTPGDARLPASLVGLLACDPLASLANAWSEPPIGVIYMGDASLAAYARPYQFFDYYESNPNIRKLSVGGNPTSLPFTYLHDATKRGANVRVFEGPERQTFDRDAPKGFYRLLVVETSRGRTDLPARELLTIEAMKSYVDALTEDGVICFHTSSRSFDLPPLLATVGSRLQLSHLRMHDACSDETQGEYTSEWLMLARTPAHLDYLRKAANLRNVGAPARGVNGMPGGVHMSQVPLMRLEQWSDNGPNSLRRIRR